MKIWFDTSPVFASHRKDCGDCINPSTLSGNIGWPLSDNEIAHVRVLVLKHVAPLYVQQCGEEQWMVCNPTTRDTLL